MKKRVLIPLISLLALVLGFHLGIGDQVTGVQAGPIGPFQPICQYRAEDQNYVRVRNTNGVAHGVTVLCDTVLVGNMSSWLAGVTKTFACQKGATLTIRVEGVLATSFVVDDNIPPCFETPTETPTLTPTATPTSTPTPTPTQTSTSTPTDTPTPTPTETTTPTPTDTSTLTPTPTPTPTSTSTPTATPTVTSTPQPKVEYVSFWTTTCKEILVCLRLNGEIPREGCQETAMRSDDRGGEGAYAAYWRFPVAEQSNEGYVLSSPVTLHTGVEPESEIVGSLVAHHPGVYEVPIRSSSSYDPEKLCPLTQIEAELTVQGDPQGLAVLRSDQAPHVRTFISSYDQKHHFDLRPAQPEVGQVTQTENGDLVWDIELLRGLAKFQFGVAGKPHTGILTATISADNVETFQVIAEVQASMWQETTTWQPLPADAERPLEPDGTYKVQAGDTLSAIAKYFGTTVDILVEANDIADPDFILAGQILTIPTR